ncbi:MAG TPA: hypothetical protein VM223_08720 [Planctomycetota bacterium]|nr:hypothetical protein [Planctomycetota bacterium]
MSMQASKSLAFVLPQKIGSLAEAEQVIRALYKELDRINRLIYGDLRDVNDVQIPGITTELDNYSLSYPVMESIVFTVSGETVSWTAGKLHYGGTETAISADSTTDAYIYYDFKAAGPPAVLSSSNSKPPIGKFAGVADIWLLCHKKSTNWINVAFANQIIHAGLIQASTITTDLIVARTIVAGAIALGTITADEIHAETITGAEIAASTIEAGHMTVSQLSAIAADMGSITAGSIVSGNISINAATERILFGAATAPMTGIGVFLGKDGADFEFRCGDPENDYIHWDGSVLTINGAAITAPVITNVATGSEIAIQGWTTDIVFSATDSDTVAWSGTKTIKLLDGTTYTIDAGNTGNMEARTYIYFDKNEGEADALQTTTEASTAVGSGKILVAVAQNNVAGKDATFLAFGGGESNAFVGTANIAAEAVTANEIAANTITAGQIQAGTITADEIHAGTITTAEILAGTILATDMTIATLSAISVNMGTITAGKIQVGNIEINADTRQILIGDATSPEAGVGVFLGLDNDEYQFRCGDPAGNYIKWDGSTFTISGDLIATGNIQTDAVTILAYAFTEGPYIGSGDLYISKFIWSEVQTLSVTLTVGEDVNIDAHFVVTNEDAAQQSIRIHLQYRPDNAFEYGTLVTEGFGTTAEFTNGDKTVIGTGTEWLGDPYVNPGDWISRDNKPDYLYRIASVTDNTHLELEDQYQAASSGGGVSYLIQHWWPLYLLSGDGAHGSVAVNPHSQLPIFISYGHTPVLYGQASDKYRLVVRAKDTDDVLLVSHRLIRAFERRR